MNPASYRADGLSLHRPYTRHSGACLCGQQRPQEVLTEAGPCPSVFLICRSTRSEKGVLSHRARRRNHPGRLGLAPVQGFIELGEVKRPQLRRGRIERHPGVLRGDDPAAASTVCRYQASTRVTASWRTCAVSCARARSAAYTRSRSWNRYASGSGESSRCASTSTSSASATALSGCPSRAAAAGSPMDGPCHRPSRRNAWAGSTPSGLSRPGRLAKLTSKDARNPRGELLGKWHRHAARSLGSAGCWVDLGRWSPGIP